MKKAFLTLLLAAISTGAMAEWVKVVEHSSLTLYIDPATIRKDGHFRRVWEVTDLKQKGKGGVMSRRSLREYDCKEDRFRTLSLSMHSEPMLGGEVLFSGTNPDKEWDHIPPGTSATYPLKFVCAQ